MPKVAGHKLFWCVLVQYNSHFYTNLPTKFVNMSRTGNKMIGECMVYRKISLNICKPIGTLCLLYRPTVICYEIK